MDKPKQEESMKGQIKSPSNREQTIANSGGMPKKMTAEQILDSNTPPKKYADDSTVGLGKP